MNLKIVYFILGHVLRLESILLLLPFFVAVLYREDQGIYFLLCAIVGFALGLLITHKKPQNTVFFMKEGCAATALSWILLSLWGCLPFWLSREIPSFTDALFETISGFTTTGASILSDVEALPRCMLFWRSFTNWIGGMGVLVFLLAVIPLSGGSNINLMRAESPGPIVGKLVPKIRYTARILYYIYFGLTLVEIILLLFAKMPLFDAVATAFSTAGTGGFGILNDSITGYSPLIQWIITIFMILFGVNFNAYYLILLGQAKKAALLEEVRAYFIIILTAILIIFISLLTSAMNVFEALTQSAFQVASIMTSTGFSTADYDLWSGAAKTVLVLLMFIGACAGSTGGGIKVSRFILAVKTVAKELNSYIHPKSVKKLKMDGKPVEHEVLRSVNVYIMTFLLLFILSVFLISLEEHDLVTNFTAVAATINNTGPGLAAVGPTQNFGFFGALSKFILMFDMLAGRLELFPLLILFHPSLWNQGFRRRRR